GASRLLWITLYRIFGSGIMHVAASMIAVGLYGWGRASGLRGGGRFVVAVIALFLAAALHSLWNAAALVQLLSDREAAMHRMMILNGVLVIVAVGVMLVFHRRPPSTK